MADYGGRLRGGGRIRGGAITGKQLANVPFDKRITDGHLGKTLLLQGARGNNSQCRPNNNNSWPRNNNPMSPFLPLHCKWKSAAIEAATVGPITPAPSFHSARYSELSVTFLDNTYHGSDISMII